MMNIEIQLGDSISEAAKLEVYLKEPASENIAVGWDGTDRAKVVFNETDGTQKSVPITIQR